jgi:hypothetical protein
MEESIVAQRAREEFGLDENRNEVSPIEELWKSGLVHHRCLSFGYSHIAA